MEEIYIMFDQLMETQPQTAEVKNRRNYFVVSAAAMVITLFSALIISLFAIDLNIGMDDMDMLVLVAPVEVQPEIKRPELETEPKQEQKMQAPGGSPKAPTRQVIMARVDESPREVPTTVSTAQNTAKARPISDYFEVGKADSEPGTTNGSGRGTGGGTGDGTGLGDGSDTIAKVVADDTPPPPPVKKAPEKPVVQSMGVINGRATSLPLPTIPAAARVANAAGTVSVQVMIDENGNVISANAVSGNPLLRLASEVAARNARFTKTLLSGTPVQIKGIINYHFSNGSAD